jgi:tetratricopeptide (TPR) repeat protein
LFILKTFRRKSIIAYGILFYGTALSVYSNLFFSTGTALAERFLYIPSFGFCIALGYGIAEELPKYSKSLYWKRIPFGIAIVVFLLFSIKTIARVRDWKDTKTLLQADIRKSGNCANLNEKYAEFLYNEYNSKDTNYIANLKQAKKYFLRTIKICPKYLSAINYTASCYYNADKNYDSALFYYIKSLQIDYKQLQVYKNIVNILDNKNDYQYSLPVYNKLLSFSPGQPVLIYRLGKSYWKTGNFQKAIYYMEKALKLSPGYKYPANDLITIYETTGDIKNLERIKKVAGLSMKTQ